MVWKPKERELTAEEAVALAKSELAPLWSGSEPMLAAIPSGKGVTAYPLHPDIAQKTWLLSFVDPTDASSDWLILYVREWLRRYQALGFNALAFMESAQPLFSNAPSLRALSRRFNLGFPIVYDAGGLLAKAFGLGEGVFPRLILLNHGQPRLHLEKDEDLYRFEDRLQRFFREADPGLAFRPPFTPLQAQPQATRPIDPIPQGKWTNAGDRMCTSDPAAELSFIASGKQVWLVARDHPNVLEATRPKNLTSARVLIEVNGSPPYEAIQGDGLSLDEEGQVHAKIEGLGYYPLLVALPSAAQVRLTFPNADQAPIEIYAIKASN